MYISAPPCRLLSLHHLSVTMQLLYMYIALLSPNGLSTINECHKVLRSLYKPDHSLIPPPPPKKKILKRKGLGRGYGPMQICRVQKRSPNLVSIYYLLCYRPIATAQYSRHGHMYSILSVLLCYSCTCDMTYCCYHVFLFATDQPSSMKEIDHFPSDVTSCYCLFTN